MATAKTKTEVATVKGASTTLVAASSPDFMRKDAGKGVENLSTSDLEIPRLVLLQSLSEEVTEGDEKAGSFYHTILEESLASKSEALKIVPIWADIRYILWRPRHEGGGILARADDGVHWNPANAEFDVQPSKDSKDRATWKTADTVQASGLDKFGSSQPKDPNSQPAAVKMWCFVVVLPDHPKLGPMVLTFQRGGAKIGANFSSKIKFADGAPAYGQIFEMTSKMVDTGSGDFYQPSLTRVGYVADEAKYNAYAALYEQFKEKGVQIKDLEGSQSEGETGSATRGKTATPEGAIPL